MKRAQVLAASLLACLAAAAATPEPTLPDPSRRWIRIDSVNFTLFSDASKARTVAIVRDLERLREVLARTSQLIKLESALPTRIYVFKDEEALAPYNLGPDGQPEGVAGYFIGAPDGNYVAIDASTGARHAIYHEYLHYLLENNIPEIPLWLNEGLAEFYSTFLFYGNKAEIGHPVAEHLMWLSRYPLIPLEQLFATTVDSTDYNEGERQGTFYAQSWALAHYLMAGSAERRGRLGPLFALIHQGKDSKSAFETAFGMDLATAERELAAYVGSRSFAYYRYSPQEPFDEEGIQARPLTRVEVLFHLGDLLAHRAPVQAEQARRHLRAVLELDPSHVDALLSLAVVDLGQEQPAAAVQLCEKALALDPDHPRVHALFGTSLLAQFIDGGPSPEADRTMLVRAREHFRRSLDQSPAHIESLVGLGRTFLFEERDVEEGISALARVLRAQPARTDILVHLIVLNARTGNHEAARSLFDRALRRRGDAQQIQAAEAALGEFELQRAHALYEQGKADEAKALVQQLVDATADLELRARFTAELASLAGVVATEALVKAVQAAEAGELERAAVLFDQVAQTADEPEMRMYAASQRDEMRRIHTQAQLVDRYNEAVRQANAGKLETAIAALEELLAAELGQEIQEQAGVLLRELRSASGTGTRKR